MGFFSARQTWVVALLASFLSLFVMVTSVDAASCASESPTNHAAAAVADTPAGPGDDGAPDQHGICSHGHCHHNGVATPQTPASDGRVTLGEPRAPVRPAARLTSRAPTGPERPPRV